MIVFPEERENPETRLSGQTWYLMQHIPASGRMQTEYLELCWEKKIETFIKQDRYWRVSWQQQECFRLWPKGCKSVLKIGQYKKVSLKLRKYEKVPYNLRKYEKIPKKLRNI